MFFSEKKLRKIIQEELKIYDDVSNEKNINYSIVSEDGAEVIFPKGEESRKNELPELKDLI